MRFFVALRFAAQETTSIAEPIIRGYIVKSTATGGVTAAGARGGGGAAAAVAQVNELLQKMSDARLIMIVPDNGVVFIIKHCVREPMSMAASRGWDDVRKKGRHSAAARTTCEGCRNCRSGAVRKLARFGRTEDFFF